jgi:prokaryotic ubiquitin-like protein Pup
MSEYARKTQTSRPAEDRGEASEKSSLGAKGKKIGEELDALLDEIDDVLEENAEEFVSSYVQHGGE